jgi:hypothetical protein
LAGNYPDPHHNNPDPHHNYSDLQQHGLYHRWPQVCVPFPLPGEAALRLQQLQQRCRGAAVVRHRGIPHRGKRGLGLLRALPCNYNHNQKTAMEQTNLGIIWELGNYHIGAMAENYHVGTMAELGQMIKEF